MFRGWQVRVFCSTISFAKATATKKVKLDLMKLLNRSAPTGVCTKQLHYKTINGSREATELCKGHKRVKRKQLQRRSN
ncbi:hypothetical protein L1987_10689 [Smallanthus sonchifolius]|uniref:Uncharacterized protein n=1 Tax=Smallanthus sonchifolius TaxID=185202 RepID=A0ACB9J9P5_9ASTR|nr:hypothetical protein L1987_10689 [Smallanthus sonchifolius]